MSPISFRSLSSVNYCDVMKRFDDASADRRSYDSFDDAFSSGYHTPSTIVYSGPPSPMLVEENEHQDEKEATRF